MDGKVRRVRFIRFSSLKLAPLASHSLPSPGALHKGEGVWASSRQLVSLRPPSVLLTGTILGLPGPAMPGTKIKAAGPGHHQKGPATQQLDLADLWACDGLWACEHGAIFGQSLALTCCFWAIRLPGYQAHHWLSQAMPRPKLNSKNSREGQRTPHHTAAMRNGPCHG